MNQSRFQRFSRRAAGLTLLAVAAAAASAGALAQSAAVADAATLSRIHSLLQEKESRTATQAKLSSTLWYALQYHRGQMVPGLQTMYTHAVREAAADAQGRVKVDITATVSPQALAHLRDLGGVVEYASAQHGAIRATLPIHALEQLAAHPAVRFIAPAARATTNVGALTSQGYISHKANFAVAGGHTGAGVIVGVMSDTVKTSGGTDMIAYLKSTGDLGAGSYALPGQDGGAGSSEGSAMMEIVQDLAPGATVIFATAFAGQQSFADNIRALKAAGASIIVDDVSYFAEPAFQDGVISQAVNDVTAAGAIYFSAAANSGNLTSGTSGTWEGDFKPGVTSGPPLPLGYTLHDFGGGQNYDVLAAASTYIDLKWSDPVAGSTNDYDLFVLNSTGTTILCASTTIQNGAQDPLEGCYGTSRAAGTRIVVAQKGGAAQRAIRIDTHRGVLTLATTGSTYGHNAAANTQSIAAVNWNSAKTGAKPFVGGASNPTETFSSDGPRKVFYTPSGTPLTPGNFLFGTNGGSTLVKPDFAAADGAVSVTPGFKPFYGTSAAAPHAAAIAALVKSARPDYTPAQVIAAMRATALDIRGAGIDRDAGYGLVMALEAVNYALTH